MNIETMLTEYLTYHDSTFGSYGKSFITKSQSGYYFPCFSVFYESEPSVTLHFVKGLEYKSDGSLQCTKINVATEDPEFDYSELYDYPTTQPFVPWAQTESPK